MTKRFREGHTEFHVALEAAKRALSTGDKAAAKRFARRAAQLAPEEEAPWLFLAAASEPRAGLAYVVRALEINPKSEPARKAIRWMIQRLPPKERRQAVREISLPEELVLDFLPLTKLARRRWFSFRAVIPAVFLVFGAGMWLANQPADADQPRFAPGSVLKASYTPTPTFTPTSTPTASPTATPTVTLTPLPSPTKTPRPNVSWTYTHNPEDLADEGRWIDVDLSAQRVTAYEGSEPQASFIVSTGTAVHPTVTGQFRVYVKLLSTPMAGPGYYLPGVPFTMYFYRGYAIHGTYWHDNFGTPMSHGCVNLRTPDAEWLFNFAEVGILVNVHP